MKNELAAVLTDGERESLEWYQEQASALARYTIEERTEAMMACVSALALDAGNRAKTALRRITKEGDAEDAARYRWLRDNMQERLTDDSVRSDSLEHKTQFVLPKLISWADFCGPITLDEAIDAALRADTAECRKCHPTPQGDSN